MLSFNLGAVISLGYLHTDHSFQIRTSLKHFLLSFVWVIVFILTSYKYYIKIGIDNIA